MITTEDLLSRGYQISGLKDLIQIERAEIDVKRAYFLPDQDFEDDEVIDYLYALVYCLLLRRRIISTRYGAVQKTNQYSINADKERTDQEIRNYCLDMMQRYEEANDFQSSDIIEITPKLFLI